MIVGCGRLGTSSLRLDRLDKCLAGAEGQTAHWRTHGQREKTPFKVKATSATSFSMDGAAVRLLAKLKAADTGGFTEGMSLTSLLGIDGLLADGPSLLLPKLDEEAAEMGSSIAAFSVQVKTSRLVGHDRQFGTAHCPNSPAPERQQKRRSSTTMQPDAVPRSLFEESPVRKKSTVRIAN